jgi:hypothetical protein
MIVFWDGRAIDARYIFLPQSQPPILRQFSLLLQATVDSFGSDLFRNTKVEHDPNLLSAPENGGQYSLSLSAEIVSKSFILSNLWKLDAAQPQNNPKSLINRKPRRPASASTQNVMPCEVDEPPRGQECHRLVAVTKFPTLRRLHMLWQILRPWNPKLWTATIQVHDVEVT